MQRESQGFSGFWSLVLGFRSTSSASLGLTDLSTLDILSCYVQLPGQVLGGFDVNDSGLGVRFLRASENCRGSFWGALMLTAIWSNCRTKPDSLS